MKSTMNKKLEELLVFSANNYDPQYGSKLASHLPMTLVALQRMGPMIKHYRALMIS